METPTIILLSATQKEAGIHFQSCLYDGNSHLYPALSNAEGSRYSLSKLSVLWKLTPLSCSQQRRRKQVFTFKVVCIMETHTFILLSAMQKEAGIYFQSCLYYGNSHLYPALSNAEGSRYLLSKLSVLWKLTPLSCSQQCRRKQVFTFKIRWACKLLFSENISLFVWFCLHFLKLRFNK